MVRRSRLSTRFGQAGTGGDIAWIHVETYSDAGKTLAKPVEDGNRQASQGLFAVGGDGMVRERRDGPLLVLSEQVEAVAERLASTYPCRHCIACVSKGR